MTTTRANQFMGSGHQARSLSLPRGSGILAATVFLAALVLLMPLRNLLFFSPAAVQSGQWWRIITHPLVHVTWYHLLLDGVGFWLVWYSLEQRRLRYLVATTAGSLLAAIWLWPTIGQTGLCGLSGTAHGLMAITALEMIRRRDRVGWLCLAIIVGKSTWEAVTGQVFFEWAHFGLMGTPVAVAHLGGVAGGIVGFVLGGRR